MPVGLTRLAFGALAAFGLSSLLSSSAHAQSALPAGIESAAATAVKLDYDATVRAVVTDTAPKAREGASFLRQTPPPNQVVQVQNNEDQGISVGVLGMFTWPSIDVVDQVTDINSRTGWGIGGWVGGNRNGRVGFVGEFIYGVRKVRDAEDDVDVDFEIFQIAAPFHINFGSRSRNSVGGYIVVGPSFTFNLGQKADGDKFPSDEEFNGVDIGIIAGAGIEFFRFGIEGRGNWGLNEISNEGDFAKIKTNTFELLFKFAFN